MSVTVFLTFHISSQFFLTVSITLSHYLVLIFTFSFPASCHIGQDLNFISFSYGSFAYLRFGKAF